MFTALTIDSANTSSDRSQRNFAHSIKQAVLMRDSVLDLHYDSIFDACPICCCNTNIRAYELGLYLNATEDVALCDAIQRRQQRDPK